MIYSSTRSYFEFGVWISRIPVCASHYWGINVRDRGPTRSPMEQVQRTHPFLSRRIKTILGSTGFNLSHLSLPLPTTPLTPSLTTVRESTATSWTDIELGDGEGVLAVPSTMFGEWTSRRKCCQGGSFEESKENVLHRLVGTHGTARKERGRRRRKSP